MKSLAINSNNDIFVAPNGNIAIVTDRDAIAQNCKTAMLAQLGEMQYDTGRGMPMRATVFDTFNPAQFTAAGRATIAAVDGVTSVTAFTVTKANNVLNYAATIKTDFGVLNV